MGFDLLVPNHYLYFYFSLVVFIQLVHVFDDKSVIGFHTNKLFVFVFGT